MSSVLEDAYKLFYSLCMPTDPNTRSFCTLSKYLNDHFESKKSYFAARYEFFKARKQSEENVAQWRARIKDLASRCNFGAELEVVLRDVFVVGMGSGKIQDRLLEDDASSLSGQPTRKRP